MGRFTFKWEHSASEVYVTGTFDNWNQSLRLEDNNGVFEKTVELPTTGEKVLYKFVVDGNWTTNISAPSETDSSGNANNVLSPEDIMTEPVQTLSSAAPEPTTAALAGAIHKEKAMEGSTVADALRETPCETPVTELQQFSPNPTSATEAPSRPILLASGEKVPDASELGKNRMEWTDEVHSSSKNPKNVQTISVAPIAASPGLGNPVHLEPGENVRDLSEMTAKTINSTVTSGADSYGKADELPADKNPKPNGTGMFGVPPVSSTLILESSLPMGGDAPTDTDACPTIQSAALESSTETLGDAVPKEPRGAPKVVTESQKETHVKLKATAVCEAVEGKKEVEQELLKKAPEAPVATEKGATPAIPQEVKESIAPVSASQEAAANPEAVAKKVAVEEELKKQVPETEKAGEPAPTTTTALSETAPGDAKDKLADELADTEPWKNSNDVKVPKEEPLTTLSIPSTENKPADSRDVSRHTKELAGTSSSTAPAPSEPTVTTGVETTTTNKNTEGPAAARAASMPKGKGEGKETGGGISSAADATEKKKRRSGFWAKLKERLK